MSSDRRRILVVDDDPAFCTIMREILGAEGFEVHVAYDAKGALSMLEDFLPDIILSDIMMPDIDGLWLIRNIRSSPEWAKIPTIVVSAKIMPKDRQAAKEAGADAFVPKPFSLPELRSTILSFVPCQ
jgi:CheY-like chemotaxis protein